MSNIYKSCRSLFIGSLLACLIPSAAQASGFALIETNAAGQGNAYAGAAANTMDASTIFFNPAGLMALENDHVVLASHLIMPDSKFTNNGSSPSPLVGAPGSLLGADDDGGFDAFVPNFYWVKTIDETMKFGLGVNTPFGLATKYNDDWVGRYHGVVSDLKTINVNPSIGYQYSDKLSIGGGLDVMLGTVELSSAIDFGAICLASLNLATCSTLGALPQASDGFVEFEGDNFSSLSLGFNFGLIYEISEHSKLGVAYRSEVDMEMEGDADFTVPSSSAYLIASGLFLDSGINADITLPQSLSFSYSHEVDKITYLADVTWTGWSSFDELRIVYDNTSQPDSATTEDWDDTFRYSIGINYQYSDDIILRTGIALDETPIPSPERTTPRLPGNDRTWLSFGFNYILNKEMSIDVGYSHLFIDDVPINNTFESSVPTLAATLTGEYEASVDIISVQFNWQY